MPRHHPVRAGVRPTFVGALAVVAAACSTSASSVGPPASSSPLTTGANATTTDVTTSTAPAPTTTAAPTATSPPIATTSSTGPITTSPTGPITTSPTTSITPTTVDPALPTTTIAPDLNPCPPDGDPKWKVRPPVGWPVPEIPAGWTERSIGRSVEGRDLLALVRPAVDDTDHRVVVVGSVHGNEITSQPTVRSMVTASVPDDVELWLIPDANPDGTILGIRCNANGVDLNRNFAWDWESWDGGPAPMSEPETLALADLVVSGDVDLVVWVHQPLRYIAPIGETDPALAAAWADASGVPLRLGITQHGGSESWAGLVAGVPSILVEVEARELSDDLVDAHRRGLEATLAALG